MFEPAVDATGAAVADRAEGLAGVPLADTLLMVTTPSTTPPSATRFPTAPMRATRLQARENLPCCHLNFPVMPSSSVVATSAF